MIKISFIQKCYRKGNYELSTLNLKILIERALEYEQIVKKRKGNISYSIANSHWEARQLCVRKLALIVI